MESKRGCYSLSLPLSLLFLGTSWATTSMRDREGWVGGGGMCVERVGKHKSSRA